MTKHWLNLRPQLNDPVGSVVFESESILVVAFGNESALDYCIVNKLRQTMTYCWGWQAIAIRHQHARWQLRPEGEEPCEAEVDGFMDAVAWLGQQPLMVH